MTAQPPDDPAMVDSTAMLASLYQVPLGEFTSRRSQLVSQLRRSGHKEVAARLATAAKPSRAAYLVNQVFWRTRAIYDAVLEAGTAARAAQQARLLGQVDADLNETIRERDAAVRAAVDQGLAVASGDGQAASDTVASQLRATFEALAAHGLEGRLPHGQLTEEVTLPGLAAFAGLVLPSSSAASDPVRRFEVVARRPASKEAVATVPDPRLVEAEALVSRLRDRRAAVEERLDELRRSVAAAEHVAAEAERASAEAARQAREARTSVERAGASRAAAESDLERVMTELAAAEADVALLQAPAPGPAAPSGGDRPRRR